MAVIRSLCLFCLVTLLAGCVSTPTRITSIHTESPGLFAEADAYVRQQGTGSSHADEISVFVIHGMGATPANYHNRVVQMFSAGFGRSAVVDEQMYEVCLGGVDRQFRGEARPDAGPELETLSYVEPDFPRAGYYEVFASGSANPCMIPNDREGGPPIPLPDNAVGVSSDGNAVYAIRKFGFLTRTRISGTQMDHSTGTPVPRARTVTVYAYWWDGDAAAIQRNFVGYDSDSICQPRDTSGATSCGEQPHDDHSRAVLNDVIKNSVMNFGLSDAALFIGGFSPIFDVGTQNALCLALLDEREPLQDEAPVHPCAAFDSSLNDGELDLQGDPGCDTTRFDGDGADPFFIFTKSLGSRILFDALEWPEEDMGASDPLCFVNTQFQNRTPVIYMSANQIPLIGLGQIEQIEGTARSSSRLDIAASLLEDPASSSTRRSFLSRLLVGPEEGSESAAPVCRSRIVAFYDRNDMLGYRAGEHLPDRLRSCVIEIDQDYSPAFLGLVTLIPKNHDQSFRDEESRRIILCGGSVTRRSDQGEGRWNWPWQQFTPNARRCW